jgi:hypothetical protein
MKSSKNNSKIVPALISGIFLIIASVISGQYLLQSNDVRNENAKTATSIALTVQTVTQVVAFLPTFTSYPTYTPFPTYTVAPNNKDLPVIELTKNATVNLPTSTSIADNIDTPQGSVLELGEWWKEDGVWLQLSDIEFGSSGHITLKLMLWNNTGNELLFRWSYPVNFLLKDNTGHTYELDWQYTGGDSEAVDENDSIYVSTMGDDIVYYDPIIFDTSVTDLYFIVVNLSRIKYAEWHIAVPK